MFNPSKSAIASSGGSASALAASLAAGALGSQTELALRQRFLANSQVMLHDFDRFLKGRAVRKKESLFPGYSGVKDVGDSI